MNSPRETKVEVHRLGQEVQFLAKSNKKSRRGNGWPVGKEGDALWAAKLELIHKRWGESLREGL